MTMITYNIMMQPFLSQNPLLHQHPFRVSQFGLYKCCEWMKRGTSSSQLFPTRAAERDSEFEIDREKAREALRKLDQQLDVMSQKQTNNVPKTKAANPYNVTDEAIKDVQDRGSFLPLAFFALLVFTIVYNIVFIKVIKPSVDGPQVELAPVRSSIMREILKAELLP